MSYHSQGGVAVANDAGQSWNLTKAYAAKSGYGPENGSTIGNFLTTTLLVRWRIGWQIKEHSCNISRALQREGSDEFSRNKNAMWQNGNSIFNSRGIQYDYALTQILRRWALHEMGQSRT